MVNALRAMVEKRKQNAPIGHAFIFSGGRGIGKTTLARIFARELGVTDKDLYEIDAASYTGVDNIRELRDGVNTLPFESPYKVYILDEAHMLSKSAFNALLKTLEEPPSHVIFMMATTELDKIPDTVQSRCEVYLLETPDKETLANVLVSVAKKEGVVLSHEHADTIATAGDASFRDALSLLQQVLVQSSGGAVTDTTIHHVTHAPMHDVVERFLAAVSAHDAAAALGVVHGLRESQTSPRLFAEGFLDLFRAGLLMRVAPSLRPHVVAHLSEGEVANVEVLTKGAGAALFTAKHLHTILATLTTIHRSPRPDVVLEALAIELCEK